MRLDERILCVRRSHARDTVKGGKAVALPIPTPLAPYLQDALEANASDFVFPGSDGKQLPEHTAITLLLQLGVAPQFVQRIARHANSRTTLETYGHLLIEDLRAPLEALGKATAATANRTTPADTDRAEKTAARSNLGPREVQARQNPENRRPGLRDDCEEDRAFEIGAEHQVRTGDLRLGKATLYQLS